MAQAKAATVNAAGPVLRDIHVPPSPWWPPAPGWWLLTLLLLLLATIAAWWLWWRARWRLAHAALQEIACLEAAYMHDNDRAALAAGTSRLLRRMALRIEPAAAAVNNEAWWAFLRHHARDPESAAVLAGLGNAPFQPHPEVDAVALLAALRQWTAHALRIPRHDSRRGQRCRRWVVSLLRRGPLPADGVTDRGRAG